MTSLSPSSEAIRDFRVEAARLVRGLSLIEMLIALLVISVGLLGMAGLQAYSLRMNTSAYQRSQANILVYDILDTLRTRRADALNGTYNVDFSGSGTGEVATWKEIVDFMLPAGAGEVLCDTTTFVCRVTVAWDDGKTLSSGHCKDNPASCQRLTVSTRL
jgi:type IV pilus assembly protein PilV